MAQPKQQFVRISIIFPANELADIVEVEKNLKSVLSNLAEYRWDLQMMERKGNGNRGLDGQVGMSG